MKHELKTMNLFAGGGGMTVLCKTRGRIGNGICPDVKVGGALCGMVGGTCAHEEIICSKCGGNMDKGKAIEQTYIGIPDFIGSDDVVTVSPGGSGKLIDCLKCSECGRSITK